MIRAVLREYRGIRVVRSWPVEHLSCGGKIEGSLVSAAEKPGKIGR